MTVASDAAPAAKSLPIAVSEEQWAILIEILARYIPQRPVWAYGSRARGVGVRPYSDLDLIVGGEPLRADEAWGLEEAFDESRLPFRVELQEMSSLSEGFRRRIEGDFVTLQG